MALRGCTVQAAGSPCPSLQLPSCNWWRCGGYTGVDQQHRGGSCDFNCFPGGVLHAGWWHRNCEALAIPRQQIESLPPDRGSGKKKACEIGSNQHDGAGDEQAGFVREHLCLSIRRRESTCRVGLQISSCCGRAARERCSQQPEQLEHGSQDLCDRRWYLGPTAEQQSRAFSQSSSRSRRVSRRLTWQTNLLRLLVFWSFAGRRSSKQRAQQQKQEQTQTDTQTHTTHTHTHTQHTHTHNTHTHNTHTQHTHTQHTHTTHTQHNCSQNGIHIIKQIMDMQGQCPSHSGQTQQCQILLTIQAAHASARGLVHKGGGFGPRQWR